MALHNADWAVAAKRVPFLRNLWSLAFTLAASLAIVIGGWIGMVTITWHPGREVDRESCDCTCWDTKFKNGYDPSGYRALYFNFDERMPGIIVWVTVYFQLALAAVKTVFANVCSGTARWTFVILFLLSIYPHHYAMWCTFGYLNEAFFPIIRAQMFFAAGEVAIAFLIVALTSKATPLHPAALWTIITVNSMHLIQSRMDQTTPVTGVAIMFWVDAITLAATTYVLYSQCIGRTFPRLRALWSAPADWADFCEATAASVALERGSAARGKGGAGSSLAISTAGLRSIIPGGSPHADGDGVTTKPTVAGAAPTDDEAAAFSTASASASSLPAPSPRALSGSGPVGRSFSSESFRRYDKNAVMRDAAVSACGVMAGLLVMKLL